MRVGRVMLRGTLLATFLVATALVCSSCGGEGERTEAEKTFLPGDRPNLILVLADDLDKSVFERSTLDSPWAPEGASFTNAVVTTPLCCPSRASILRGQYAHNTGLWRNEPPNGGAAYFRDSGTKGLTSAPWRRSCTPTATRRGSAASS